MASRTIPGKDLLLSVDGVVIGCASEISFSSSAEMLQAACRESGGFFDAEPGMKTATLSVSGFVKIDTPADAAQMRYYDLFNLHLNGTRIQWVFGTEVVGEQELYGEAFITSYEQSAPNEDNATYSLELQVVGAYGQRAKV